MDVLLAEFDLLRGTAESAMHMGGAHLRCACHCVALRRQNAESSRPETSSVLASEQGNSGCPSAAKRMGRLFGPRDAAARQDVVVAADCGLSSDRETDFEACAARRETTKKTRKRGRRAEAQGKIRIRVSGADGL